MKTRHELALLALDRAERKLRRAFHSWEKALATVQRMDRKLDKEFAATAPQFKTVREEAIYEATQCDDCE